MKAVFIRHGDLKYPYNSYDKLSLYQLDLLATEKVQPSINIRLAKSKIRNHKHEGLFTDGRIDTIYHSPTLRATETALLISDELNVGHVKEMDFLKEVSFSPKKLVSEADFKLHGMEAVREAVYEAVAEDGASESFFELIGRVNMVKQMLLENKRQNIAIVTHGFFMRLLQISLIQGSSEFSVEAQRQATNYDYLKGFIYDYKVEDIGK